MLMCMYLQARVFYSATCMHTVITIPSSMPVLMVMYAIVDDVVLMGTVLLAGLGFVALLNIPAIKGMVVKSSQAMLDAVKAVASFKLKPLQARKEPSRSLD